MTADTFSSGQKECCNEYRLFLKMTKSLDSSAFCKNKVTLRSEIKKAQKKTKLVGKGI